MATSTRKETKGLSRYVRVEEVMELCNCSESHAYIRAGDIDIDDREDLIKMHEVYHNLGGNGNLNALMETILDLPLRKD